MSFDRLSKLVSVEDTQDTNEKNLLTKYSVVHFSPNRSEGQTQVFYTTDNEQDQ